MSRARASKAAGFILTNPEFFFTDTSVLSPKAFYRLDDDL